MLQISALKIRSKSFTPSLHANIKRIGTNNLPVVQTRESFDSGLTDYEFIRILGKGSFATVRLAIHKSTGEKVAIKSYEKATPQVLRNVRNEIKVLEYLDHPNIVKLLNARQENNSVHLIMEYVTGSSLENYIKTRNIDQVEAAKIFKQILNAVNYYHMAGVVHRDLKLTNILIDTARKIKIIDFGFATISNESQLKLYCGTTEFMAPEMVSKKPYCGHKVDMWALGVILYVLLTKSYPFIGRNEREILRKIALGGLHNISKIPVDAMSLIKRLLTNDPNARITAKEALNDAWLGINKYQSYHIYEKVYER